MSFRELIGSFKRSVQKGVTKNISATDVRIIKIFEYLYEEMQNDKDISDLRRKDLQDLCQVKDSALELMIKNQNQVIKELEDKLERQNEVFRKMAESFSILAKQETDHE